MNDDGWIERTARIRNRLGLHARPAGEFVKVSGRFASEVEVEKEGLRVNGKSILGVMMLAAEQGSLLIIRCRGSDAEAAVEALLSLVDRGFEEE